MSPARQAAAAAFAELDAIDRSCLNGGPAAKHSDQIRKDIALRQLGAAMDDEFGPLYDRDDDIGDELADREDRP